MSANQSQTEATLTRHLQAFASSSVDGVMQDYTEESVFVIPDGPLHGLSEIRKFFTTFIETLPAGFLEAFRIHKIEIAGELGYLLWEASPWVLLGTDTFLVRNEHIMMQTFAAHPLSWSPKQLVGANQSLRLR
jgi:ketosteroid isomerase-like protein